MANSGKLGFILQSHLEPYKGLARDANRELPLLRQPETRLVKIKQANIVHLQFFKQLLKHFFFMTGDFSFLEWQNKCSQYVAQSPRRKNRIHCVLMRSQAL